MKFTQCEHLFTPSLGLQLWHCLPFAAEQSTEIGYCFVRNKTLHKVVCQTSLLSSKPLWSGKIRCDLNKTEGWSLTPLIWTAVTWPPHTCFCKLFIEHTDDFWNFSFHCLWWPQTCFVAYIGWFFCGIISAIDMTEEHITSFHFT